MNLEPAAPQKQEFCLGDTSYVIGHLTNGDGILFPVKKSKRKEKGNKIRTGKKGLLAETEVG